MARSVRLSVRSQFGPGWVTVFEPGPGCRAYGACRYRPPVFSAFGGVVRHDVVVFAVLAVSPVLRYISVFHRSHGPPGGCPAAARGPRHCGARYHVLFSPEDFIARLAALVPRPECNLTRYHDVFAPNSAFRRAVVPDARKHHRGQVKAASCRDDGSKPPKSGPLDDGDSPIAPLTWAQRLKRVFEFDITLCPHCGGRLRVIAGGRLRT